MGENEKADVGTHYPDPAQIEAYLASPENEKDQAELIDSIAAKAQLEKLDIPVPAELQMKIDELEAKNPISQLPGWVKDIKWIKGLKLRKKKLEKGLEKLGDNTTVSVRKEIEGQIVNCTTQLETPEDSFGGKSRAEYAEQVRKVIGLKDENEQAEGGLTPEQVKQLETIVKEQYESAVQLLKVSGLLKDSDKNPSKSKVENLLKNNISPEQFEVIKRMEKPTLQLVPKRTCAEYVTALNKNKPMPNQNDAYVSDWTKKAFERADKKDKGYRIVITEGSYTPTMLPGEDIDKTVGKRCEWFKNEFQDKGVSGIDLKSYMLLQMSGFTKASPRSVDDVNGVDQTWTMLTGEEISGNRGAGGHWYANNRQVYLFGSNTDVPRNSARFRASVMVDVI
jgi:hypothetical protein